MNTNARFEREVECKEGAAKSCVWTCATPCRLVSAMDDDIALIRQLCTRVGRILEDTSIIALIWDDGLAIDARLAKILAAASDISALVAAAGKLFDQ